MNLTSNIELVQQFMNLMFIFIFSILGAYVKDIHNTYTGVEEDIKLGRIIVASVVSTIIIFSLSDYILPKISYKLLILPCFIGGVIGFELFGKINNVTFWIDFLSQYFNFKGKK
ncbi:MAG: hypothetical protein ACRCXT_19310 [Paraclostridium sp.]